MFFCSLTKLAVPNPAATVEPTTAEVKPSLLNTLSAVALTENSPLLAYSSPAKPNESDTTFVAPAKAVSLTKLPADIVDGAFSIAEAINSL